MSNPQLKRTLNFYQVAFYGIGTILGAGIYALIGKIVGIAGILAPLSFAVSAIVASLTAYSYTHLVRRYPKSAGEAEYVFQSFKLSPLKNIASQLSNLVGWAVALTGVVSCATLINGSIGYFQVFLPLGSTPIIFLLALASAALAIKGIKESAIFVVLVTLIEIAGLLMICFMGFDALVEKNFMIPHMIKEMNWGQVTPILSGAFLAFYAFIGFEDMVNLAEETKDAEKTMPKAIVTAMVVSVVLYILVTFCALAALSLEDIHQSDAPLSDMYREMGGNEKWLALIALFAIGNGILAQIIMSSRILYGLRHPFKALNILSKVHPVTQTPVYSTLFVTAIILLLTLFFSITDLAGATSFIILIVFTLVNASLILCEIARPQKKVMTLVIPGIGILLNLMFLFFKLYN